MPSRILFRADASAQIGAGHVMRCLSFAETLSWAGWLPVFAVNREAVDMIRKLNDGSIVVRVVSEDDDVESFEPFDVIVIDHYQLGESYERRFVEAGKTVVAIDDVCTRRHAAAILVDSSPQRAADYYVSLVPADCRVLAGPRYALIAGEWRRLRKQAQARSACRQPVQSIMVSMGATDPTNASAKIVSALNAAGLQIRSDIVLGSAAPHRDAVARALKPGMNLLVDPQDFPARVAKADLVIGTPGQSSLERATLGVPSLVVPVADNQNDLCDMLARNGAAECLPREILDDPQRLGARISTLVADGEKRALLSRAAARLVDGRGALRLLCALSGEQMTRDGLMLRLRVAEEGDSGWLLALQRQPATRRFARNPQTPAAEQHEAWFAAILEDLDRVLLIVETSEGLPAGFVRLDRLAEGVAPTFEVSIAVDQALHGRGVGAAALTLARRFSPGSELIATVLEGNVPSERLFASMGYRRESKQRFRSVPS
jgi:UDP-2,4-diacetamido-2,4,6-trideoxy-beta-L-altropyranose hydrolase